MKKNYSKSGFTLVELLIAVGLFVIIISIAVGGFINALRTQREVSSLIATQSNVSLALEQMTREIRTGYLFCHLPDDFGNVYPSPNCGCTISDSGYNATDPADPSSEADSSGNVTNGDYPTWTCSALDYYTADGTHVNYSDQGGGLIRTVTNLLTNTTSSESITGDNVNVQTLHFVLFGNIEGDNWTPRITIAMGVSPSSTDTATMNDVLNLQTTVSARTIDCTLSGQC
jgi:prepilin-type N-terminal cleavage/methylation domain-containing protein